MTATENTTITVETTINAPVEKVWKLFTNPADVTQWNNAIDTWHSPRAENDLRAGGKFLYRMEAKDGSMGFDFAGTYDEVRPNEYMAYTLGDGRKVKINFKPAEGKTTIVESFDLEQENPAEMQRAGWQAILDNFKRYAESNINA